MTPRVEAALEELRHALREAREAAVAGAEPWAPLTMQLGLAPVEAKIVWLVWQAMPSGLTWRELDRLVLTKRAQPGSKAVVVSVSRIRARMGRGWITRIGRANSRTEPPAYVLSDWACKKMEELVAWPETRTTA